MRSIANSTQAAITSLLIAFVPLDDVLAADQIQSSAKGLVLAQSSLGGSEPLPPQVSPAPEPAPAPLRASPAAPRTDYIPPNNGYPVQGSPNPQQNPSGDVLWGAIAFTADGSWSSDWKMPSRPEAESRVLRQCAGFGHGACEVASLSGQECVGLATFIGHYRRRRWLLSFTAGGMTYPDAQGAAVGRCNSDERTQGRCQFRTAACADGR